MKYTVKRRGRLLVAGLLLATSHWSLATARADDIWDRRDPRAAFLFNDNRGRNIGDLLTISIDENTENNEREERALSKATSISDILKFAGKSSAGAASRDGAPRRKHEQFVEPEIQWQCRA